MFDHLTRHCGDCGLVLLFLLYDSALGVHSWKKNCPQPGQPAEECLTAFEYVDPWHHAEFYAQLLAQGKSREEPIVTSVNV